MDEYCRFLREVFDGLVQGFEFSYYEAGRVVLLPPFKKAALEGVHSDIRCRRGHYKVFYSRLCDALYEYAKQEVHRDDRLQFGKKEAVLFVEESRISGSRLQSVVSGVDDRYQRLHQVEIYRELHRSLFWKSRALFGNPLVFTRGARDRDTVRDRLVLLRACEAIAEGLQTPLTDPGVYRALKKSNLLNYQNEKRVFERQLLEAQTLLKNVENGIFPGLYEESNIKNAISFYSGGRITTRAEFDLNREKFPSGIKLLVPKQLVK